MIKTENSELTKEDLLKLKNEIDSKVIESLDEEGIFGLAVFTLENFAFRYLETSTHEGILAQKEGQSHFFVESIETDPMKALKVSDPVAKKAMISLAKRFSASKGVGLQLKQQLHIKFLELDTNGSGVIECRSTLNWNMDNDFKFQEEFCVEKTSSLEFSEPILLRNKLALLLEEVCEIF